MMITRPDMVPADGTFLQGISRSASGCTRGLQRLLSGSLVMMAFASTAVQADDLLQVYRQAQSQDAVFETARRQAQAAVEKIPQARSGLLPMVSLNFNTSRQSGDASFAGATYADRTVRGSGTTLQFSQSLYRRAAWIGLDQAGAQVRQAMALYEQARQELILRVSQRYFDVLLAQESASVASLQLTAVSQQLELARRNFEVGMSTVTDVHEAKARFDLSRAQRIVAFNDLELRRYELERVLGTAPGELALLRPDAAFDSQQDRERSMLLEVWVRDAKRDYPLVRAQEAAREVAEKEVARAEAGHFPTIDLTASYGKTFNSGSMSSPADIAVQNHVGQVALQLSVPVFSGGATTSKMREAVANLEKASAELDDARRQAVLLARQAYAAVESGQAQMEALQSAVQSSKSAVDANKVGYLTGTRINIDVLNAEQQLYAAQRDLAKSRIDTLMGRLRLKAAAGVLDESDVHMLNNLLKVQEGSPASAAWSASPAIDASLSCPGA